MDLFDLELLPVAVFVLVPGLVAMKVFGLFVPRERMNWSDSLLEVFGYGALNFAAFFWVLRLASSIANSNPFLSTLAAAAFLFVTPALLGALANVVLRWDKLRGWVVHPTPTGWDHFFGKGRPCWVLLRLKTGGLIGGYYGEKSLASSFPQDPDIYLEKVWRVDVHGRFLGPIPQSAGMWIRMEDCLLVEFFELRSESPWPSLKGLSLADVEKLIDEGVALEPPAEQ